MNYTIAYTISACDIFGVEKIVLNEAVLLQKNGFKVFIVVIYPDGPNAFLDKAKKMGVSCYHLVSNKKFDFAAIIKLKNFLKKIKCDLVHSNKYKPDLISLISARIAGIPVVTTVHGWCSEDLKARIYERMQAFSWRFFDRVICISESYKQKALRCGVDNNKLEVVHNGILIDNYENLSKNNKNVLLAKYGIPQDNFIVGIIGRLSVEKGHRYFIEAAHKVIQKIPNVSFVIIGDGKEKEEATRLINSLNLSRSTHLLGHIDDIKAIYSILDLTVISSLKEGLPGVLLESMLYGVCVVASNVGGIPEVITDKEDGILVPVSDSHSLADAIVDLISHPETREKFAACAKKKVVSRFNFKNRASRIEKIYVEVIIKHRRNNEVVACCSHNFAADK